MIEKTTSLEINMEGCFLYYQIERVLEQQSVEIENYYKGRGILLCETKEGLFALKEFHGRAQKAEYLYDLGQYLNNAGIACDFLVKNKDGELLTEGVDGVSYSFHHWAKGRECDVKNRMDILMTVSLLAKLHCVETGDFLEMHPGLAGESLYHMYERHDRELRRIRKYIGKRNNRSPFEQLFLKCYPEYVEQSQIVLQRLTEERMSLKEHTLGICHGDFNQHNILLTGRDGTFLHMEHARVDAVVSDLSNFLRKILEKYDWNEELGVQMLTEYSRVCPLQPCDWRELYDRLSYPEKFWKIANRYLQSNKVWDSGKNYEKLMKEIRSDSYRQRFLRAFRARYLG